MFLTIPELRELTELERQAAIRRWLDRARIPYMVSANGWPKVLRSVIMERLGGEVTVPAAEPRLRLRHG